MLMNNPKRIRKVQMVNIIISRVSMANNKVESRKDHITFSIMGSKVEIKIRNSNKDFCRLLFIVNKKE